MAILTEMRDPRVRDVTITRVVVSPDMREAKIYVSIMGDTAQQNLCLHGLQSARGFLQSKLADRIETRYTPRLQFILDMGVKKSLEIARILQEVLPPKPATEDKDLLSGEAQESNEDFDGADEDDDTFDDLDDLDLDELDESELESGELESGDPNAGDVKAAARSNNAKNTTDNAT